MPQQMRHPPLTFTWPPSILAAKPAVRRETSPSIRGTRRTSSRRFHIARPLSGDTRREEVERREAHEDLESLAGRAVPGLCPHHGSRCARHGRAQAAQDRKSTRLNSSHLVISYAVFCLKKK